MGLPHLIPGRHGTFVAYPDDTFLGEAVCHYGEYGEEEARLLLSLIQPDQVIIEVGANAGYLTVPLARKARVVAIEPQKNIFRLLVSNVYLNALEERVSCFNVACGSSEGVVYMPNIGYEQETSHGAFEVRPEKGGIYSVPTPLSTVDKINKTIPSMIKIDVEGYELEVLKGAADTIREFRPALYVENDRKEKSEELISYLWDIGYDCSFHIPMLFNKDNWLKNSNNIYPDVGSFNMLCAPKEYKALEYPVTDAKFYPVKGSMLHMLGLKT